MLKSRDEDEDGVTWTVALGLLSMLCVSPAGESLAVISHKRPTASYCID